MIDTFKSGLAQLTPANPHSDGLALNSGCSLMRNFALATGPGVVGILIFLLLLSFEAGALVSFAVMYFIFVPMSRAFYERYSLPHRLLSE
jgi:hypothetical protein